MTPLEITKSFDVAHIPNLDVIVLAALELFSGAPTAKLAIPFERPLVLGSGNAYMAAQIIFADAAATFADESAYERALAYPERFDGVVVMSASGGKHAVPMCQKASELGLPLHLITNTSSAPAAAFVAPENVHVYPKNREPYTYNTSTYLGPVLAHTGESPAAIKTYIENVVAPRLLRNFENYSAFTFLVPKECAHVRAMIITKFDELFGPQVHGRCFTPEEAMHAKTVVVSGDELFISLGCNNTQFGLGKNRLEILLPENAGYAAIIAASYYVVGKIQAAHPPYFAKSIEAYASSASALFGQTILPIVE
jgi:hypothetical protein